MKKAPPPDDLLQAARATLASHTETGWQRYHCKLVTPMYGGGTKAGEVDENMPVRATAIRGQLRYWWRLLNRGKYPDSQKLFKAERAIWGGLGDAETLAASQVEIRVESPFIEPNQLRPKDRSPLGKMIITEAGETPNWLMPGYEFQVLILNPTHDETVSQAFRLWASFGGIGARRRRGLGAVEVVSEDGQRIFATQTDLDTAGCKLYRMQDDPQNTYREAVEKGLQRMIDFRQKAGLARGEMRENRPGGSLWPEANAVRNLTGRARPANKHALGNGTPIAFPRALFGLPIVFQFRLHERQGDPHTSILEVADDGESKRERFASPLIFGALAGTRGTRTIYYPAVLLLPTHLDLRKQALKLRLATGDSEIISAGSWWPSDPDARKNLIPKKLQSKAGEKGDVLTAFINYFIRGESV